ncbi:MAG: 4-diphosphocytidyl-2-C-methyl-D-erythritol kinase [Firmicutes bacterium]|nr:4-diphosphocytidyl-2-C-methyl-D-erythritol kinase [candidate division NPL-UPA2 bacterium]
MAVRLLSPAKVNLRLRILGRRADGYHEIDTVVQSIDLCDEITIALSGSSLRVLAPPHLPSGEGNLCYQAAQVFFARLKRSAHASVWLTKRIPVQAGLGGGSSNAAAVLLGLNHLHENPFNPTELSLLGATLGSDVPFFLTGGTARAWGRGEHVEPLPDARGWWLRIVKPELGLSTAEVYALWRPEKGAADVLADDAFFNDLEQPAQTLMPALADFYRMLIADGAERVLLCGSGSAVCGFYSKPPAGALPLARGHREFVARTMTRLEYSQATAVKECELA